MKFLLSAFFITLLLSACGQTGKLVLPPEYDDKKTNEKSTQTPAQ